MSKGQLHQLAPGECLVAEVVEALAGQGQSDLSAHILLLPTQRLATMVAAGLAYRVGHALVPPQIMTLDPFLLSFHPSTARKLDPGALSLLLGLHICQGRYQHIMLGHERELALFYQELAGYELSTQGFKALKQVMAEDIYRNDEHMGSLFARIEEMETIHNWVQHKIKESGLQLSSAALSSAATTLLQTKLEDHPQWRQRPLWLVGFTSLLPQIERCFCHLIQSPRVQIWLSASSPRSPLDQLKTRLLAAGAQPHIRPRSAQPPQQVAVVTLPSPLIEAYYAVRCAHQLIADGLPPSQIALLVTNEADYGQALKQAAATYDIECNIALATSLSQTLLGGMIDGLISAFVEGDGLDLLLHPLTQAYLEKEGVPPLPATFYQRLLSQPTRDLKGLVFFFKHNAPKHEPQVWEAFDPLLAAEGHQRPPRFWLQELLALIVKLGQPYLDRDEPESRSTREVLETFARRSDLLESDQELFQQPVNFATFWQIFGDTLTQQDVRTTGEPLHGVQIISLAESRHIPFAAAIILGCNEGSFPKGLPRDDLVDDYLKRRIGLPGWHHLEAMEDQTFHLLRQRIPRLILTRCRQKGEEEQIRSRFIEALVAEGQALLYNEDLQIGDFLDHDAKVAHPVGLQPEAPYPGDPAQLVAKVSPTSLGQLLTCPYRYFLYRQGLKPIEFLGQGLERKQEGEWLHKVIEMFFDDKTHPFEGSGGDFTQWGWSRLMNLTQKYGPRNITATPLFLQLRDHSWPALIRHFDGLFGDDPWQAMKQSRHEVEITEHASRHLPVRGQARGIKGIIDSVDAIPRGMRLITDYKRQNPPPLAQVKRGEVPQLFLYAWAISEGDPSILDQTIVGYYNIIGGQYQACAVGTLARPIATSLGLATRHTPDLAEQMRMVIRLWELREEDIMEYGRFYADPSECTFCSFAGLCRKTEPQEEARMLQQSRLRPLQNQLTTKGERAP